MSFNITSTNGIEVFTITRPDVRNAVNYEVMDGLDQFITSIEKNSFVKWAVITSEGGQAFCSGGDLGEFHTLSTEAEAYPMLSRMTNLLYRLATLHVPVIALMDGTAVGGGCEIAAACDIRLMKTGTKAGFIQGTLAITTGWGGASLLYEKEKDHARLFQFLAGAAVQSAEELLAWGWVTELYETNDKLDALHQFTSRYNHIEAAVLQAYKAVAVRKWTQSTLKDRMIAEAKRCSELWESDAHHAAVQRFRTRK